ncbi:MULTISPECIES: TlpA family protein disulfide reductase [Niastella]|uniref:TlpA family protein disulfide reductase n=1 Tax=Niastella soli TaxID=2821487 RepID=A0ABS3Z1H6_9BACT|nr:TlpA disulfide reductase family protein [Niastella soli]MBO9204021.1 TlpA family protein disulfide reductase [Niastella soli]
MKITSLLLLLLFNCCHLSAQYEVDGQVALNEKWSDKIYIYQITGLQDRHLYDSIQLNKSGHFVYVFNKPLFDHFFYQLSLNKKGFQGYQWIEGPEKNHVYLFPSAKGNIQFTSQAQSFYYSFSSTPNNIFQQTRQYEMGLLEIIKKADPNKPQEVMPQLLQEIALYKKNINHFFSNATNDKDILFGTYLLYLANGSIDSANAALLSKVKNKNNPLYQAFYKEAASALEEIILPDFPLLKPDSTFVNLHETGKGVKILYYWASWCSPCRKANTSYNLEIKRLCEENDVQFIGISIDTDNNAWKKAIQKDQVTWMQLMAPAQSPSPFDYSRYGAVPQYSIVNEDYKIIYSKNNAFQIINWLKERSKAAKQTQQ